LSSKGIDCTDFDDCLKTPIIFSDVNGSKCSS
jgi:hypothetical protein